MSECFKYKVILKRHKPATRPDICVFYDEDRTTALNAMAKYVKANGFSIRERDGLFSIGDVLLVKSSFTGEIVSETPYHRLFNTITGKLLEGGSE